MTQTAICDPGFALYIHWPFCLAKCPYCDFNSHVTPEIEHGGYLQAYRQALSQQARDFDGRALRSIFFGGGTPSLMKPQSVQEIINLARQLFGFEKDIEITLEANPTSTEKTKLGAFADAGVNRISLGVQSFSDKALQYLGREHSAKEAEDAIEAVSSIFSHWSFDLIYARPHQTLAEWQVELERALAFNPKHLSLYQLTIEPGTAFKRRFDAGQIKMPSTDQQAAFYEATTNRITEAGLQCYEVSNYAVPGHECRHNLVYWRYGDYLGVGPGAHGRVTMDGHRFATLEERVPERWRRQKRESHPVAQELIDRRAQLMEMLLMGLRLQEGIHWQRIDEIEGELETPVVDRDSVISLRTAGLLIEDDSFLRVTDAGLLLLDSVTGHILL